MCKNKSISITEEDLNAYFVVSDIIEKIYFSCMIKKTSETVFVKNECFITPFIFITRRGVNPPPQQGHIINQSIDPRGNNNPTPPLISKQ